ncbi:class I SAM-dependent methyltransferase [Prodigiosinella confusarubida]|uniref:Class I SAM-dependent methyltransferase n=1 Tax=Serratia sp. (strain ATCC 39006) TaxID=104623 RepID=A0A2I5T558_SERS3|nr:class I SAM-dependent methyltransferase [Serratia sp. ATCC 39006]AUG99683.1 class I SAM-dependent methyltransferase [Serratia sp. ATCC 39006]AUH04001.1 class I SAM-dependent methyltransferase [Serratia sp. ATCC 39006]
MKTESHNAIITRQYATQATAYLNSTVHAQGDDLDLMAQRIGQRPDATILDLGCGGGHVSFRLAPRVHRVVACDLAQSMLDTVAQEAVKRNLLNIVTKQGAAESLSCPSESFDVVATRYSAHHWRHIALGIEQMARTLKPGGMGMFMDVVSPGDSLLDTWLQSIELLRDPSHVRNASLQEWQQLLAAAGLAVREVKTFRLRLEFSSWVERMKTHTDHIVAIRSLQQHAGAEVTEYFDIVSDGSFTVDTALIIATKA